MLHRLVAAFVVLAFSACEEPVPLRKAGVRAPLSVECDALDETRCLLPWPSSTFTVADPSTMTGVRVSLALRSMPVLDAPTSLNRQDGFSVVTPLAVGFPLPVAARSGQRESRAMRLFLASPGDGFGEEVPLRTEVVSDADGTTLLLGWPQRPLAFSSDYVAVVLDEVGAFTPPRTVEVAAGAVKPATDAERALFGYHAPSRQVLARAGITPSRVLRLWDFTTRSASGHARPMDLMRAAALDATIDARVTSATLRDGGVEVRGVVGGLPYFVTDAGVLAVDGAGEPRAVGVHEVPFRAVLPVGAGPLPMVLFGHGTGSDVSDPDLDDELLATGAGKFNLEFAGWNGAQVGSTFAGFVRPVSGAERSTAGLAQSLVDASALEAALGGGLGAALTAPALAGQPNPVSGRTIDATRLAWFGSSLGGTLGFTHAQLEPRIGAAVLNVPGAGCTQFLLFAEQWQQLDAVFSISTPSAVDRALALVMSQGNWDLIDGAVWSAQPLARKPLLIQESMGDPVLPNVGSELAAAASRAVQVSAVLEPVFGVESAARSEGRAALTQFRVPASVTGGGIHTFVKGNHPAGRAAREQLQAFLSSFWAGAPVVTEPPTCVANGARGCDFR